MAGAVMILAALLAGSIQHVQPIAMNMSPENDSTTAQLVGAANAAVFECDIYRVTSEGELFQVTTTWTIQPRGSMDRNLVIQSDARFSIGGTATPSGSFSSTYRNMLTVVEFTEDLDGAVLMCGTHERGEGFFNIKVYRAPQLATGLTHEVVEATPFAIDLTAGSQPFPYPRKFQWTRNGVEIGNSSAVILGYPGIVLHNVSRADSGVYSLNASNYRLDDPSIEIGSATGTFELDVLYGPDIVRGPLDVVKVQGGDALLVCSRELSSNPSPVVAVWLDNNGKVVDPESTTRVLLNNSDGFVSLSLSSVAEGDAGEWVCIIEVENVRTVHYSITLTVLGSPSQPRNVRVVSTGPTWASLQWDTPISPGFPPSADMLYVILASRGGGGAGLEVPAGGRHQQLQSPPTSNLSANITGLLPNSGYELTVLAQYVVDGIAANSTPSNLASTTTSTTVPEMKCETAPVSTNGMIAVTWQYIHTGGLNLSHTSVLYALSNNPHPQQFQRLDDTSPPPTTGAGAGSSDSFVESGLAAGSSYIFKVVSSNAIGNSSVSCPPVQHHIGIPQRPELLRGFSSGGGGSVTVEVATNESGTEPMEMFQFDIKARHAITQEERSMLIEDRLYSDGQVAVFVLTELEEGSTYSISVSCVNSFGVSEESDPLSVTVEFSSGGLFAPAVGSAGAVMVATVVVIILALTLCCVYKKRKHEREKRVFSPAKHREVDTLKNALPIPRTNGVDHICADSEFAFPASKKNPMSPKYDTIPPPGWKKVSGNTLYDSLAPIPPFLPPPSLSSLPPPSPSIVSSTVKQHIPDSAHNSMGHLSCTGSSYKTSRSNGFPAHSHHAHARMNFTHHLKESRRKSLSVPDILDVDLPPVFLDPVSVAGSSRGIVAALDREGRLRGSGYTMSCEGMMVGELQSDV